MKSHGMKLSNLSEWNIISKVKIMKTNNYKKRLIDDKIELYLKTFGAIYIEGPKWCGKTWTSRHHSNSEFLLADPIGNFNNKKLAELNPELALEGDIPHLIDEWQEVPSLWDAIRGKVDSFPLKGQFILTGSATVNKEKYIHSGTGRIARLKMRPMSLFESGRSNGKVSLKDICYNNAVDCLTGEVDLNELINLVLIGGWPAVNEDMSAEQGVLIAKEYIKSLINEDIYKVDNVKRNQHKFELLLRSLARNEATTVTNKTLKNDIKEKDFDDINIDTLSDYLDLLNKLYITENIPPFSTNLRSSTRVKQSEKRHFVDPSLPCAILNLTKEKLLNDLKLFGFLFESLVERDLYTYSESFNAKLYHYQDYRNDEIDAIIELEDGEWCGFEIKLGANQIDEAAENLVRINNSIRKEGGKTAKALCVICGLTNAAYKRKDGVYVVPFTSLRA